MARRDGQPPGQARQRSKPKGKGPGPSGGPPAKGQGKGQDQSKGKAKGLAGSPQPFPSGRSAGPAKRLGDQRAQKDPPAPQAAANDIARAQRPGGQDPGVARTLEKGLEDTRALKRDALLARDLQKLMAQAAQLTSRIDGASARIANLEKQRQTLREERVDVVIQIEAFLPEEVPAPKVGEAAAEDELTRLRRFAEKMARQGDQKAKDLLDSSMDVDMEAATGPQQLPKEGHGGARLSPGPRGAGDTGKPLKGEERPTPRDSGLSAKMAEIDRSEELLKGLETGANQLIESGEAGPRRVHRGRGKPARGTSQGPVKEQGKTKLDAQWERGKSRTFPRGRDQT